MNVFEVGVAATLSGRVHGRGMRACCSTTSELVSQISCQQGMLYSYSIEL